MYFEEQTILDVPKLPTDHPAFWLEDAIIVKALSRSKQIHDKEHEDMLEYWGCKKEHTSKLTIRKVGETFHSDRLYHCMLHLKYWKDKNINMEFVNKFEEQFPQFKLEELTLPQPSDAGSSAY